MRRRVLTPGRFTALGLALLVACAARPSAAPSDDEEGEPCGPISVDGSLIEAGKTIAIGELHGTNEIPGAVSQLLCEAARKGIPVVLGIEHEAALQPEMDRYLLSDGRAAARRELLTNNIWMRPSSSQDGRASLAMFHLVEYARLLRQSGRRVTVAALVQRSSARDELHRWILPTASTIVSLRRRHPDALVIVLMGRAHLSRSKWPSGAHTVGSALSEQIEDVVMVRVEHGPGTAWVCIRIDDCKPEAFPALRSHAGPLSFAPAPHSAAGHDAVLAVGDLTASPPAKSLIRSRP